MLLMRLDFLNQSSDTRFLACISVLIFSLYLFILQFTAHYNKDWLLYTCSWICVAKRRLFPFFLHVQQIAAKRQHVRCTAGSAPGTPCTMDSSGLGVRQPAHDHAMTSLAATVSICLDRCHTCDFIMRLYRARKSQTFPFRFPALPSLAFSFPHPFPPL